jgi:protein-disulfide isomerase
MKRILPFVIILLVLGVAVGSAYYLKRTANSSPVTPPATNTGSNTTAPANTVAHTNSNSAAAPDSYLGARPAHTLGPANAPAHLEEFGDFQCPPCGLFHPILKEMKREFGDKLRVTFREFPLSQMHKHAVTAASAAEAAGMQGKFWEMHALIFENQQAWHEQEDARPFFEAYAKQIGLDIDRYKRDMNGEAVAQRILEDGKRGQALGVKGTPTVYLNGVEVPFESLPADKLRLLIEARIKK